MRTSKLGLSALLCLVASCSSAPVQPQDLHGYFLMNQRGITDQLWLCTGFVWIQAYQSKEEAPTISSGSWELDTWSRDGETRILLRGYVPLWRREEPSYTRAGDRHYPSGEGYSSMLVQRQYSGRIRLVLNSDLGRYYVKQDEGADAPTVDPACETDTGENVRRQLQRPR
jgi:hypothetical protein